MKYFKSFLLASVFSSVVIPASLSAAMPDSDELARIIVRQRAYQVAIVDQEPPAQSGWFSFARKNAGNFLRGLGNELRTKDDSRTAAGRVTKMLKTGLVKGLSYLTGFSLDKKSLGNALRTVGQSIKGGQETQTTTRVILNNLGLKKSSEDIDIEKALRMTAEASLKADAATAIQTYEDVVLGLNKRGFSTKSLDTKKLYLDALARQTLVTKPNVSSDDFSRIMFAHGMPVLKEMNGIKEASDDKKLNLMNNYLGKVFNSEKNKIQAETARNLALAAPTVY